MAKSIVDQMAGYQTGSPFAPDAPAFKEGEASTHALGVLYQAPWDRLADGFNEHARRCARALALTGCPVHLRGFGRMDIHGADRSLLKLLAPLLDASIAKYSVRVQQLIMTATLAQTMGMHRFLTEEELRVINHYRVVYSVFERDRVSPEIAALLNRMGQVWVACHRNVGMLERSGVDRSRIKVVPVPYFDDDPLLRLRLRARRPGVPRFYHIGKWEPRKAQDKILVAFMMAFKPGEASFVLKTSAWNTPGGDYPPDPETAVAKALQDPAVAAQGWKEGNWRDSIELISKRLTDAQLVALHGFGDVCVNLSRGEGFCAAPGTEVDTVEGPVAIERLAEGTVVFTHTGRRMPVIRAMRRRYQGQLVSIKVHGLSQELRFTPEHRHYVVPRLAGTRLLRDVTQPQPQFQEAGTLKPGDLWAVPKRRYEPSTTEVCIDMFVSDLEVDNGVIVSRMSYSSLNRRLVSLAKRFGCSMQHVSKALRGERDSALVRKIRSYAKSHRIAIDPPRSFKNAIRLTAGFMFFVGHYISDGHADKSVITLSTHRRETWGRQISTNAIYEAFGLEAVEYHRKNSTRLCFSSVLVARFLRELCGHGSSAKYIPEVLKSSPHACELLRGLFYGDGCSTGTVLSFSTTSSRLASDVVDLCGRFGVFVAKERSVRTRKKPCYQLRIPRQHQERFIAVVNPMKYNKPVVFPPYKGRRSITFLEDDNNYYLPISRVSRSVYKGLVHNIAVAGDESYTCHGYATHNCMPAFDAKLAGNRIVYTPSGGQEDFAEDDILVPEKGSVKCHSFYGWENDAEYLDYDIEDAVQALRDAVTKPRTQATSLPPVPVWYQAKTVGENMLKNLGELMSEEEKVF